MNLDDDDGGGARAAGAGKDVVAEREFDKESAAAAHRAAAHHAASRAPGASAIDAKERGNVAFRAGEYDAAAACYDAALEMMSRERGVVEVRCSRARAHGDGARRFVDYRDAAVCYANRAAARLMRASCVVGAASASAASAIRAANDVRLALEDCLNALSADPSFDRARLRAGTCLMKLGAFREAARTFDACAPRDATGGESEARKLAAEALRAAALTRTMRTVTLPSLRSGFLDAAARGVAAAMRTVAGHADAAAADADADADADAARRAIAIATPLAALAPHASHVAETRARALFILGDLAAAARVASFEGLGGDREDIERRDGDGDGGDDAATMVRVPDGDGDGDVLAWWRVVIPPLAEYATGRVTDRHRAVFARFGGKTKAEIAADLARDAARGDDSGARCSVLRLRERFVSFRFVSFRFVSFRFVSFRFSSPVRLPGFNGRFQRTSPRFRRTRDRARVRLTIR